MKRFKIISFFCTLLFLQTLQAQQLIRESVIDIKFSPISIHSLSEDRYLIVSQSDDYCASNHLHFLMGGEVINSIRLIENFAGQVIVGPDKVIIWTTIQMSDVTGIYSLMKYEFDHSGNMEASDEYMLQIGGTQNHIPNTFSTASISSYDGGIYVSNNFGDVYQFNYREDFPAFTFISLILTTNWQEVNEIAMFTFPLENAVLQPAHQLFYASDNLILTQKKQDIINDSIYHKVLEDIRFADKLDDEHFVVVAGNSLIVLDHYLNEISTHTLAREYNHFYLDANFLYCLEPVAEVGSPDIFMDYYFEQINVESASTVKTSTVSGMAAQLRDFYVDEGILYTIGQSGTGSQSAFQQWDLGVLPTLNHSYNDLAIVDQKIKGYNVVHGASRMITIEAELTLKNQGELTIEKLRSIYLRRFPLFCAENIIVDYNESLEPNNSVTIILEMTSNSSKFTDGGDSLLFDFNCLEIFPYNDHHMDEDESNNKYCPNLKLPSLILSTHSDEHQIIPEIFPNPASSEILLTIKNTQLSAIYWQIIDVSGKIQMSGSIRGNISGHNLDISDLPSGMYIIKLSNPLDGHLLSAKKLIKN